MVLYLDILTCVYLLLQKIHIVWLKNKIILSLKMPLVVSVKFILIVENFAASEGSIAICDSQELLLILHMRKSALHFTLFLTV
jgi:hypothetical protein